MATSYTIELISDLGFIVERRMLWSIQDEGLNPDDVKNVAEKNYETRLAELTKDPINKGKILELTKVTHGWIATTTKKTIIEW